MDMLTPSSPWQLDMAVEQLHESEARFRDAFWYAGIGKALVDLDGRFLEVNPALCAMLGFGRAELCARTFQELTHPDDLADDLAQVRALLAGEVPAYQIEKRYFHQDGRTIHALLTVSLVRTSQGVPRYFVSQLQDITASRRLEAELRASEARYRTLVEHLPAIVYTAKLDALASTAYISPQVETMLGYPPEAYHADPELWFGQVHPDDQPRLRAAVAATHAGQEPAAVEYRVRTRDGQTRWLQGIARVADNEAGQPHLLHGFTFDITVRKQAEQALAEERAQLERRVAERTAELAERTAELAEANAALAQALRLKDEFLANVSHEFRTPLGQIIGRAERLIEQSEQLTSEELRYQHERIIARSNDLLRLINDVLDLSRLNTGDLSLTIAPVSVADLLEFAVQFVQKAATLKRLAIAKRQDPQVSVLDADGPRLKQILYQLLANAVKFTPVGGSVGIEVSGDLAAGTVAFTVWDTGIGIDAAQAQQLVEPFVQIAGHLARPHEGAGIGLALVRRLVDLHRGTLRIESRPGEGSRFMVTLPWRSDTLTQPPSVDGDVGHTSGNAC